MGQPEIALISQGKENCNKALKGRSKQKCSQNYYMDYCFKQNSDLFLQAIRQNWSDHFHTIFIIPVLAKERSELRADTNVIQLWRTEIHINYLPDERFGFKTRPFQEPGRNSSARKKTCFPFYIDFEVWRTRKLDIWTDAKYKLIQFSIKCNWLDSHLEPLFPEQLRRLQRLFNLH